jgi:cysteine rich repeat protein
MIRLLVVIPLALVASTALAQQRLGQDACARDVSRFCRSVMNDGDAVVLQCLKQNRHRLSKACDKVMAEHGQ